MPKAKPRRRAATRSEPAVSEAMVSKPAVGRTRRPERRVAADPATRAVKRLARSHGALLAAEVERLERELAAARRQLAALAACADIDPLSGLQNRRAFERELARALASIKRHGTNAALLYLDLDDFKQVNDCHGHAAGDVMLRAVADVLTRHVRESDIVARIGGDEFALLLWHCDEAAATSKAAALEAAVGRTIATCDGARLSVGASAGVTLLLPLDRPTDALSRADRAMYARKATRRVAPAAE